MLLRDGNLSRKRSRRRNIAEQKARSLRRQREFGRRQYSQGLLNALFKVQQKRQNIKNVAILARKSLFFYDGV